MKIPHSLFSKKNLLSFCLWFTFFLWAGNTQAQCNIHDHGCQFHSIGTTSAHVGVNEAHHTKGTQITPNIEASTDGLFIVGVWDDNASGSKADLDVDALLPDATWDINNNISGTGAFIITNNASRGGAESSSDPFSGIADEHNRHVSTFQEQITFANATATAIHSQDANGLAPIPPNTADSICNAISADSCEAVQITGNIPTGFYGGAVTNYDVHNLPDPSTPNYNVFAYAKGVKGTLVTLNPDPFISGSMTSRGEVSNVLSVFFRNWDFNPHAEGVVLDNYQRHFYGKTKYANPYSVTKGDYFLTYQKRYRDYWGVNYQDTISGQGKVQGTEQKGLAYRNNNVHIGTDFVGKALTPEARARRQRERLARERARRAKELARQMNKYDAGTLTGNYAGPIRPEINAFGDNALVLSHWKENNPEGFFNLTVVEPAQNTFLKQLKGWEDYREKALQNSENKIALSSKGFSEVDKLEMTERYKASLKYFSENRAAIAEHSGWFSSDLSEDGDSILINLGANIAPYFGADLKFRIMGYDKAQKTLKHFKTGKGKNFEIDIVKEIRDGGVEKLFYERMIKDIDSGSSTGTITISQGDWYDNGGYNEQNAYGGFHIDWEANEKDVVLHSDQQYSFNIDENSDERISIPIYAALADEVLDDNGHDFYIVGKTEPISLDEVRKKIEPNQIE